MRVPSPLFIALLPAGVLAGATSPAAAASWRTEAGTELRSVHVGNADQVFGVSTKGDLLRRTEGGWIAVNTGGLVPATITPAGRELYLLDEGGLVFQHNIRIWYAIELPDRLDPPVHVEGVETGELYLLTEGGRLYSRRSGIWRIEESPVLRRFSVGVAGELWGIDTTGAVVYRFDTRWQRVEAPSLESISVGADGTVLGLSDNGIFMRAGNDWRRLRGPHLLQLSVGDDGTAYGVGPEARAGNTFVYQAPPPRRAATTEADGGFTYWRRDRSR